MHQAQSEEGITLLRPSGHADSGMYTCLFFVCTTHVCMLLFMNELYAESNLIILYMLNIHVCFRFNVRLQLRYTGVLETTRIRRDGYSVRMSLAAFLEKFVCPMVFIYRIAFVHIHN